MAYIFLDESGTHKNDGNTSMVLVFVATGNLELLNLGVIEAENKLRTGSFHWADHNWNFKEKFLKEIVGLPFELKVLIFKNPFSLSHYERALKYTITNSQVDVLVIDGKKSKNYKREYKKILRSRGIILKKLILGNDQGYPVLRVADFVAGLMRNYSENQNSKKVIKLYEMILPKISFLFSD